jgi:hypothetical protein
MRIKKLFQSGLGLALVALVSVQAGAFMNTVEQASHALQSLDYGQLVDSLAVQRKGDEVDCSEMLSKIDEALHEIDASLDAGVSDEESLLEARDALVAMRLDLPCLSEQLAQAPCCQPTIAPANIVSDVLVSEQVVTAGLPSGALGGAGGALGGAGGAIGGAGGAIGGGGGLAGLLRIGGLTGGIIAAASSSSDDPVPSTSL